MKKNPKEKTVDTKLGWSQLKSMNLIDPLDRQFNFELWLTLVRSQMQAALRQ